MSVDVSYDKVEKPAHLTNIRVNVNLPNGDLKERKSAVQRVAERCTVHETLRKLDNIAIDIIDMSA